MLIGENIYFQKKEKVNITLDNFLQLCNVSTCPRVEGALTVRVAHFDMNRKISSLSDLADLKTGDLKLKIVQIIAKRPSKNHFFQHFAIIFYHDFLIFINTDCSFICDDYTRFF